MDKITILEHKKANLIKSTQKTIKKLFDLYNQNKLNSVSDKLDKLKIMIDKNIDTLEDIDNQIQNRQKIDLTAYLLIEYLYFTDCHKTVDLISKRCKVEGDTLFYKNVDELISDLKLNDCSSTVNFIKQNKYLFKKQSTNFCKENQKDKSMYISQKTGAKDMLMYLTSPNELALDKNDLYDIRDNIIKAYGISKTRLQHRILYGLCSYMTPLCGVSTNDKCPACMYRTLRKEIPSNRNDHSIVLCDSGDIISETNRGYVNREGEIFGEKYLGELVEDTDEYRLVYFM